jgi:primase-polymerase (primpol)-like protein
MKETKSLSPVFDNLNDNVAEISTTVKIDVEKPKPFFNPNPHAYSPEMKEYDQWLYSHLVEKADGSWSKPPCDVNGYYIDGTDSSNLTSFKLAFPNCRINLGKLSGLAFSIQASSPIKAIDMDHVYDPITGKWNQQALEELKSLNTRVEWSPSHTGVHVFFKCPIMLENKNQTQSDGTKREIYFGKHIVTVTGEVVEGFTSEINEVDPELIMQLYKRWFPVKMEVPAKRGSHVKSGIKTFDISEESVNNPDGLLKNLSPTKDQVIEYCSSAPGSFGEKFDRLLNGDISTYKSKSEADIALAGMIAFHTSDYGIIKEIVHESALWDEKWERNDYCQRTIRTAIRNRWG